jgi:hypothetical protein
MILKNFSFGKAIKKLLLYRHGGGKPCKDINDRVT